MKELKCPHCQKVFSVDESEYADLLNQVRNDSFNEELSRRVAEMQRTQQAQQRADKAEADRQRQEAVSAKEAQITILNQQIEALQSQATANLNLAVAQTTQQLNQQFAQKEQQLNQQIEDEREKNRGLQSQIDQSENNKRIAVLEEQQKAAKDISDKEIEIQGLKNQALIDQTQAQEREKNLIAQYTRELAMKDEAIAQYKDFKLRLSTKGIGESLEIFCNNQYELSMRPLLPQAQFGKDNDVVDGTKGDFVFRDFVDGTESVSIMFEMKNEADETDSRTKHKNSDFFAKLDSDRRKKNCEYAVLVTLLELDNDLYNNGIYAVPDYDKMYVVRPQQFLTIIQLLIQMGRNTVQMKHELAEARSKEVDVTNFENKIGKFREDFLRHCGHSAKKFEAAISAIDDSIAKLQKVKDNLLDSQDYLRMASDDTEDLTIRKLTYRNPTMKAKFDEARANNPAGAPDPELPDK